MKKVILILCGLLLFPDFLLSGQTIPPDTRIELERYGGNVKPRTNYKLTILADGSLTIQGVVMGKEFGPKESKISQEDVKKLLAEFENIDYFSFKQYYNDRQDCPRVATDATVAVTYLRINGRSKWVNHYQGCRGLEGLEKLTALEKMIDEVAKSKELLKTQ
jgi:hypothetical protein